MHINHMYSKHKNTLESVKKVGCLGKMTEFRLNITMHGHTLDMSFIYKFWVLSTGNIY